MTQDTTLLGDRPVHRIGFGAMQLAGPGVFGPPRDPEECRAVLRRAIELGVDHIDTSQFYGPNVVNELIHEVLFPYPEGLQIVTKVGARRDDSGGWLDASSPAELRSAVEENLRTLELDRLDLVNLRVHTHDQDVGEPADDQLHEMAALRDEGKLALIGMSNVSLDGLRRAIEGLGEGTIGEVQNAYSLVNRADEPTLAFCETNGIAYVPFFPLASAFAGGPAALAADPAIAEVAERRGVTPSQIALAWLLHHSPQILLIPGTSSVAHLEENLAVGDIELDADDLARLDEAEDIGHPQRGRH